jgi:hypothetical protein
MNEHPINRVSGFAPILLSAVALYAALRSYHHAAHEDGNWHVWLLALFLQVPIILYFVIQSRREIRRAVPVLVAQGALWGVSLLAGSYQTNWS